MLTDNETSDLIRDAGGLAGLLAVIVKRYRPGGRASHSWHMDWLDRASLLGEQLQAALDLETIRAYPAALAIVRTSLEHHLIDRLIVLGHRWRQEVKVPSPQDPDRYEAELKAAEAAGNIISFTRTSKRRFLIVRKAPHFQEDPDEWISTYSEWAEHYNPFRGPVNLQDRLIGVFMDVADRTKLAAEARELRSQAPGARSRVGRHTTRHCARRRGSATRRGVAR